MEDFPPSTPPQSPKFDALYNFSMIDHDMEDDWGVNCEYYFMCSHNYMYNNLVLIE